MNAPISSTAGRLRLLARGLNYHDTAPGAGYGTLDSNQVILGIDHYKRQILDGHAIVSIRPAIFFPLNVRPGVAHMPIDPGERIRSGLAMRLGTTRKSMAFDRSRMPTTLARADHVHQFALLEYINLELLAFFNGNRRIVRQAEFPQVAQRGQIRLLQVPQLPLVNFLGLLSP